MKAKHLSDSQNLGKCLKLSNEENRKAYPDVEMELRSTALVLLLSSSVWPLPSLLSNGSILPAGGSHSTNAMFGFSLNMKQFAYVNKNIIPVYRIGKPQTYLKTLVFLHHKLVCANLFLWILFLYVVTLSCMGKRNWRMIMNGELREKLKETYMVYLEVLILTSVWTERNLKKNLRTPTKNILNKKQKCWPLHCDVWCDQLEVCSIMTI